MSFFLACFISALILFSILLCVLLHVLLLLSCQHSAYEDVCSVLQFRVMEVYKQFQTFTLGLG